MSFDTPSFACIQCGARSDARERCGSCDADALMDLRDPSVRNELIKEDDERQSKRRALMVWVAVPLAALLMLVLGGGLCGIVLGGAAGYGLSLALAAIFPARRLFPYVRE